MKIIFSEFDLDILNAYTKNKKSVFANRDFKFLKYGDDIMQKMINEEKSTLLEKLGIDKFAVIFIDAKPFLKYCKSIHKNKISIANKNELQNKLLMMLILSGKNIHICDLDYTNEYYSFKKPERVYFEINGNLSNYPVLIKAEKKFKKINKKPNFNSKHIMEISEHLSEYNINIVKSHVKAAINDFNFITKFNEEVFYHGLVLKSNTISKEAAIAFYEDERFLKTAYLDLSRQNERNAFIALYGITFLGLKLEDIYSIDGIFNMQPERETDNNKRLAGQKVFNLITGENKNEIIYTVENMSKALCQMPLTPVNLDDHKLIKTNYPLYIGLSDIGSVFSSLTYINMSAENKKSIQIAKCLSEYSSIVRLYESVYKSKENKKINDNLLYPAAVKFALKLKNAEFAYELSTNLIHKRKSAI